MDLSHWDLVDEFTLHEAACLASGIEPRNVSDIEDDAKASLIFDQLNKACLTAIKHAYIHLGPSPEEPMFKHGDLPSIKLLKAINACIRGTADIDKYVEDDNPIVSRERLVQWFLEKDYQSSYSFAKQEKISRSSEAAFPTSRAHVSDKLAKINQASSKFWGNAARDDRGTHPDNASVAAWLVKQGFSPTLADKAATIIRPEWAPTGRKSEE